MKRSELFNVLTTCCRDIASPSGIGVVMTAAVFVLVNVGCSQPTACVAGQQVDCACPGGKQGVQVCLADGSAFGGCGSCQDGTPSSSDGSRSSSSVASSAQQGRLVWTSYELVPQAERGVKQIWVAADDDVWAVGDAGLVVRMRGSAVTRLPAMTTKKLTAIWGASSTDVWIGGENGMVLHWNGSSISVSGSLSPYYEVRQIYGVSATAVFASGDFGVAKWDGQSWNHIEGSTVSQGAWASSATDVWSLTNSGVSRWNGSTWSDLDTGFDASYYEISGTGPNDVWVGGDRGTLVHWNGLGWAPDPSRDFSADLYAVRANDVWGAFGHANIQHWDGTSWTDMLTAECNLGSGPHEIFARAEGRVWVLDCGYLVRIGSPG